MGHLSQGDCEALSDTELVERVREGDLFAFNELWCRHRGPSLALARGFTSRFEPDDLVSEAYTRVLAAIQSGGGPTTAFRAYLFTTIRNVAISWSRKDPEIPIEQPEIYEDPTSVHAFDMVTDNHLTLIAFRSLPERWQSVLWYTVVEELKPRNVAMILDIHPNTVAALAYRAREGLRQAWIQAHLRTLDDGSVHHWAISRLAAFHRNRLTRAEHAKVAGHMEDCKSCAVIADEAKEVASRLRSILLPVALGVFHPSAGHRETPVKTDTAHLKDGQITGGNHLGTTAQLGAQVLKVTAIMAAGAAALTGTLFVVAGLMPTQSPQVPMTQQVNTPAPTDPSSHELSPRSGPAPSAVPAPAAVPTETTSPQPDNRSNQSLAIGRSGGQPGAAPSTPPSEGPSVGIPDPAPAKSNSALLQSPVSPGAASEEPTVTSKVDAEYPSEIPSAPPTSLPHIYEAESPLNESPAVYDCSNCSEKKRAGLIGHGKSLIIKAIDGRGDSSAEAAAVDISYTNGDSFPRTAQITINGASPLTVVFPPTPSWDTPSTITVHSVLLKEGNTITVSNQAGWAPDIDFLRI